VIARTVVYELTANNVKALHVRKNLLWQ